MAELTLRYVVMSMASEGPFDPADPDGVFVLKPWKDPAALRALETYRDNCYPELARDLQAWIGAITTGPTVRGDVGRRNEPFVKSPAASGGAGERRRPRSKATSSAHTRAKSRVRRSAGKRKKRSR